MTYQTEETVSGFAKWKKPIIGGAAVAVLAIGGGIAYTMMSSPKAQFLTRAHSAATATKLTQNYDVSVSGPVPMLSNIKMSGTTSVDGKNSEATVNLEGLEMFSLDLPNIHVIQISDKTYINVDALTGFIKTSMSMNGLGSLELAEYGGQYTEVKELIKAVAGEEGYNQYAKDLDNSTEKQEALTKELRKVVTDYLTSLEDSKFTAKGDDRVLTLGENDLKNLMLKLLEGLRDSKNYNGDKTSIDTAIQGLNENFDQAAKAIDLSATVSLGKTTGDSQFEFKVTSDSSGEVGLKMTTKAVDFKAPQAPEKILSEEELQAIITEIQTAAMNNYMSDYDDSSDEFSLDATEETTTEESTTPAE